MTPVSFNRGWASEPGQYHLHAIGLTNINSITISINRSSGGLLTVVACVYLSGAAGGKHYAHDNHISTRTITNSTTTTTAG